MYHLTNEILAVLARRLKRCVVTVHDLMAFAYPEPYGIFSAHYYQLIYRMIRLARGVICDSHSTRNDVTKYLRGTTIPLIKVIHLGVDHDLFRPRDKLLARSKLGLPLEKKLVLHVGNDEPRKNVPSLIKAFYNIHKKLPDSELVRIGRTLHATHRLVDDLGLSGVVKNIEPSRGYMSYAYNAADVFVFPSIYEGFGMPLLEAMASGCPIVASDRTSVPEILGGAGITVSPFNNSRLADAVEELLDDEASRKYFAERALERSMAFDWERCARETLEFYEEVGP
jgi:glycosyltransferase involved in cell wall biosynthesis